MIMMVIESYYSQAVKVSKDIAQYIVNNEERKE